MRRKRALIIGGSIGGLFAAHFLKRAGWDAVIFERSAGDLADRGAGLGITAELFQMMRRAGLRISRSLAFHVPTSVWLTQSGAIGCEIRRGWDGSAWAIIYKPLRAAFPSESYRTGMTLERVEQDESGVTALFADGQREHGDLLVAADGVYSTIRRQFLPNVEPHAAGYIAWRGLVDEKNLPEGARDLLFDRSAFSLPEGELTVSLPVPGAENDMRPGHRRYYFIWYRPADATRRAALFTDASGRSHGLTIPPPLIRPEFIAEMKEAAKKGLPPILGEIVALAPQPLLQSITDMEAPHMVFGRVALLGDSAFLARPHVAAGATKAALDAASLADALEGADDIAAGLACYERERLAFGRAIVAHSRYLGAYLEAQLKPLAERSAAETVRDPEKLLAEYGAPHLVHGVDPASLDD
ncbi:MAG TPA: FAD-dependent monooxygenase [Stellaceae bacterium]|nr:FAD-dependent monooxygenase [Stellaceae bacterium]